jgi:hypothetical protein
MRACRKIILIILVILILLAGYSSPLPEGATPELIQRTPVPEVTAEVAFGEPFAPTGNSIEDAQLFDEQQALNHVAFLAGDALEGRLAGSSGGRAAGEYIAARLAEYGLQPAGPDSSYFQPFNTTVTVNIEQPVLMAVFPGKDASGTGGFSRRYQAHIDFVPRIGGYIGSGDVSSQVVWLGSCTRFDLYATLAGQIVLCKLTSSAVIGRVVDKALKYQLGGLLIMKEEEGPYARSGYGLGDLIGMPVFGVSPAITRDLLAGDQYTLENLNRLKVPTTLSVSVRMAAAFERIHSVARNVLGLLPGSDPQRQNEIVIIGAHYDHVGRDPDGTLYNGANDNATGVAIMLEIARLWQSLDFRPARSVLFAAWDAEEQGLFGSQYYVSNPAFPLDSTVAMLNLEMGGVGHNLNIAGNSAMADRLQESAFAFGFTVEIDPEGGSDDIVFQQAGIPAGVVAIYPDSESELAFHRPEDDFGHIQPGSLRMVGVLSAHTLAAWSGGKALRSAH